jgi:pantoate--beta-alanine ligase
VRVVDRVVALQEQADRDRAADAKIALVPTMGALHAGHLSLIDQARQRADRVYVSIFVNPTQFSRASDLESYPRDLTSDLDACRAAGVDVVFAPTPAEMQTRAHPTWEEVIQLTEPLCGRTRPGHFCAVADVVSKLLLAAKPHIALFGEKDFQQLAVIRRMVADLGFDVEIVGVPTVREADGLALSSRNQNLHPEARPQATVLVRALDAVQSALESGERAAARLLHLATVEIEKAPLARVEYVELRDPHNLAPAPERLDAPTLLALAVVMDSPAGVDDPAVRLIDNRVLPAPSSAGR